MPRPRRRPAARGSPRTASPRPRSRPRRPSPAPPRPGQPGLAPACEPRGPKDQHERHDRGQKDETRPGREVELEAEEMHALLGLAEERVEPAHGKGTDDGSPEARQA